MLGFCVFSSFFFFLSCLESLKEVTSLYYTSVEYATRFSIKQNLHKNLKLQKRKLFAKILMIELRQLLALIALVVAALHVANIQNVSKKVRKRK